MKIKFTKILASLLLLVAPVASFTHSAAAKSDCIWVNPTRINISKKCILNRDYLNSLENKLYFLSCIIQSQCLCNKSIEEIVLKFNHITFLTFSENLYDKHGRVILVLYVPGDTQDSEDMEEHVLKGSTTHFIPIAQSTVHLPPLFEHTGSQRLDHSL
jgi:hypothetical protein